MAAADSAMHRRGPLAGIKVVEFVGIGPGPMCGMLLADLGADVLRVDRTEPSGLGIERPARFDLLLRGKRIGRRRPQASGGARARAAPASRAPTRLIEGFRPGTMERIGLGPDEVPGAQSASRLRPRHRLRPDRAARHRRRATTSTTSRSTGALHAIGRAGAPPTPPLNLLGDYAGGALLLAFGIVQRLAEREAVAVRARSSTRR